MSDDVAPAGPVIPQNPTDEERGLYYKYRVQHAVAKIQGDDLFVLDLVHDPYAEAAMHAWWNYGDGINNPSNNLDLLPANDLYLVTRHDDPTGKHKHCSYFILNFSRHHDRCMAAIKVYVDRCRATHPNLATDLWAKYIQPEEAGW